ncbi:MAG: DUF5076 domain-containing protein [Pseudomonadota bacterium]
MALFSKRKPVFEAFLDPRDGLEVRINTDVFSEAGAAGVMLADFAQHMAKALAQSGKADTAESALHEMLDIFVNELEDPTDAPEGGMLGG